jgi:hypothetical protein
MNRKLLNTFDMKYMVDSYQLGEYLKAHEKGQTDAVIETTESISDWKAWFTKVDVPWVALRIPPEDSGSATGANVNVIWKIVEVVQEQKIIWKKK